MAIAAVLVAVAVWWQLSSGSEGQVPIARVKPLTAYPGEEWTPRFSPKGDRIAFTWSGEDSNNLDVWVRLTEEESLDRLTNHPAPEGHPAWSPDGQNIVFGRLLPPASLEIVKVPSLGGAETVLAAMDWMSVSEAAWFNGPFFDWSSDGVHVVFVGRSSADEPWALFAINVNTLQQRRLTEPPRGCIGDVSVSLSSDGRQVAYHRALSMSVSEIFRLRLSDSLEPVDDPEQLTSLNAKSTSPVWINQGRELIFSSDWSGRYGPSLWRIPSSGVRQPARLEYSGEGSWQPTVSPDGDRLAFARLRLVADIWEVRISQTRQPQAPATRVARSTSLDLQPSYSPEGDKIAFSSDRTGSREIWICDRSGDNLRRLTQSDGSHNMVPSWSPDGTQIAYASDAAGSSDICIVDVNGGQPRRVTLHPMDDSEPVWSDDGRWLYFTSKRSGVDEIWKVPADGGKAIQVTKEGGMAPRLAGDKLYYLKGQGDRVVLVELVLAAGQEHRLLDLPGSVDQYAVAPDGIYYISSPEQDSGPALRFYDFADGSMTHVLELAAGAVECAFCLEWEGYGLSVSPDGDSLLFAQLERKESDLWLVEGFR